MLVSPICEGAAVAVFLWMLVVLPHSPLEPVEHETLLVPLIAPAAKPEPMPKPVRVRQVRAPRPVFQPAKPRIMIPKLVATRERSPLLPRERFTMPKAPEVKPAPVPPAPKPRIRVMHPAAFSTGSSAKPTLKRMVIAKVQTGGFGDPQGLPGRALGGSKGNVPKLGSFDLPSGPGHGNGSGGAHGVPGAVASAGFGNGIAVAPGGRDSARTVETSSGFGNAVVSRGRHASGNEPGTGGFVPAVIISKPNPVYPAEARKLHIEGQVLLSVVFEASGRVRVERVIRGLGHGMDEAAERAAEGIDFKPARRDGEPVDMEAVVHIIFQLAY